MKNWMLILLVAVGLFIMTVVIFSWLFALLAIVWMMFGIAVGQASVDEYDES